MNEYQLRKILSDTAPDLPPSADRIASIRRRANRQRALAAGGITAAVTVTVLAGTPLILNLASPGPLGSVGAPAPTSTTLIRTEGCGTTGATTTSQSDASEIAQQISSHAEAHYAEVYADAALQETGPPVRVYRKPSPSFDAWVRATFSNECIELADAAYSAKELESWSSRVSGDEGFWDEHGINLASVGTDPVHGVVRVGASDVEKLRRLLIERYGSEAPLVAEKGGGLSW